MKIGIGSKPNCSDAVIYEAMTVYGPACPRAQYQSCTTFIRPTLPQLWSWYPTPVVSWRSPSIVYEAVTAPCGTEGSHANSMDRSAPNSMYPVDGLHGGTSPVNLTSTEISSAVASIRYWCRSPVNRFLPRRTSAWSLAADHSLGE